MISSPIKIIFAGTPKFAAVILSGLVENNYKPVLVITAPDKPAGRKKIITGPPVKITAQKYNINVAQPEKIGNWKLEIGNLKPDLIISSAYGQIIPSEILKIPKYGVLGVHPSLLPKHRGPSPIQTAILRGDKKTGITIYLMDEKIDHGPILAKRELEIKNLNYQELNQKLAQLGVKLLIETIPKWVNKEIKAKPQDESKATYTKIFKKEDGKIDWKKPAQEIERQIRAFYPWPGSFTFFKKDAKKLRVKILEAKVEKIADQYRVLVHGTGIKSKSIGQIFLNFKNELTIKCGKDYLIIKKIQPEGKREMTGQEFLRGYSNFVNV